VHQKREAGLIWVGALCCLFVLRVANPRPDAESQTKPASSRFLSARLESDRWGRLNKRRACQAALITEVQQPTTQSLTAPNAVEVYKIWLLVIFYKKWF
jgi:hypothetical protein